MFRTQYDKEAKQWSGCDNSPLYNQSISFAHIILRACSTFGPKIAQISDDTGIQLNYDEIRLKSIRAAQNLQQRGYRSKKVFGILAKNSHHLAPIVFASVYLGCPVNTLDPSFGKAELLHMLKTTKPTIMFCDIEFGDLVRECLIELDNNAKIFTFGGTNTHAEQVENLFVETHNEDIFVPVKVDGVSETAIIVCSSGTTGLSKGVCLSHAAFLDALTQTDLIKSSDVAICFSSLYWLSGWAVLFMGMMSGATRIITTQTYSPELQLRLIEKYKVSFALNAPHHVVQMLKSERLQQTDLSSQKFQLVIGAKTPLHVQADFNAHLPNGKVHVSYGLSEIAGILTINSNGNDSVGQVVNCSTVKIIDDDGNRCGIGENGEICIKSNYKFLGYYGNQSATDELHDDDGFILTADIGHFDEHGDLFIVDRKKDLIKYCAFQISPSQIESYLLESLDIKSVCVIGIPDDAAATDLPAAFVVRSEGANITETNVFDMVADHFADYCKLRGGVFFVDSIPMTPSGKILRRKVRDIVQLKQ